MEKKYYRIWNSLALGASLSIKHVPSDPSILHLLRVKKMMCVLSGNACSKKKSIANLEANKICLFTWGLHT